MATPNETAARDALKAFVMASVRLGNERKATAVPTAATNPYDKYLLPQSVTNYQPAGPLFDEVEVNRLVDDGLKSLEGPDLWAIIQQVAGVAIGAFL